MALRGARAVPRERALSGRRDPADRGHDDRLPPDLGLLPRARGAGRGASDAGLSDRAQRTGCRGGLGGSRSNRRRRRAAFNESRSRRGRGRRSRRARRSCARCRGAPDSSMSPSSTPSAGNCASCGRASRRSPGATRTFARTCCGSRTAERALESRWSPGDPPRCVVEEIAPGVTARLVTEAQVRAALTPRGAAPAAPTLSDSPLTPGGRREITHPEFGFAFALPGASWVLGHVEPRADDEGPRLVARASSRIHMADVRIEWDPKGADAAASPEALLLEKMRRLAPDLAVIEPRSALPGRAATYWLGLVATLRGEKLRMLVLAGDRGAGAGDHVDLVSRDGVARRARGARRDPRVVSLDLGRATSGCRHSVPRGRSRCRRPVAGPPGSADVPGTRRATLCRWPAVRTSMWREGSSGRPS